MTRIKHTAVSVIAAVAVLALVASPASARVYERTAETPGTQPNVLSVPAGKAPLEFAASPNAIMGSRNVAAPLVETVEAGDSSGFDWAAASIGAATVFGIGIVMSAAVLFVRRRQRPAVDTAASV
jgi:hypothetical protein